MYGEAQYVMAALADEAFLHLDWSGREGWSANLLEQKLFKTHRAGEEVFERIDQLLARRDPFYLDLAQVYLMALALGFEGKFREAPDGGRRLASYRRRLLEFLAEREPELLDAGRDLVPEAYESTLDQERGRRLPHLRPWVVAGVGVLALWVAIGHLLWNDLIADLDPLLQRILAP
jgi:type VI secretion system protein ImpK